jgi:hypothetical protein
MEFKEDMETDNLFDDEQTKKVMINGISVSKKGIFESNLWYEMYKNNNEVIADIHLDVLRPMIVLLEYVVNKCPDFKSEDYICKKATKFEDCTSDVFLISFFNDLFDNKRRTLFDMISAFDYIQCEKLLLMSCAFIACKLKGNEFGDHVFNIPDEKAMFGTQFVELENEPEVQPHVVKYLQSINK